MVSYFFGLVVLLFYVYSGVVFMFVFLFFWFSGLLIIGVFIVLLEVGFVDCFEDYYFIVF